MKEKTGYLDETDVVIVNIFLEKGYFPETVTKEIVDLFQMTRMSGEEFEPVIQGTEEVLLDDNPEQVVGKVARALSLATDKKIALPQDVVGKFDEIVYLNTTSGGGCTT